ncbi:MAG: DegT/DnrJ/EryC1/StrS family aminotransferase, partial [Nitrosopumilaceae archaeon]
PVHIYGNPCNYDSVRSISEENKIPVIEDACQAHGALFNDRKVGSLGDVGCFSFYSTKNMTVGGDGGMVTTDNEEIAKTIRSLRDNGRISKNEHDKLGYTMRLNTVNAAIGRVQLTRLDENNKRRRNIAQIYKKELVEDCMLKENSKGLSVYHQIVIRNNARDKIMTHLSKNKIGTAIHYPIPIHKQPLYSNFRLTLPKSEQFSQEVVSLPSYPLLKDEDIKLICEKINEVIQ